MVSALPSASKRSSRGTRPVVRARVASAVLVLAASALAATGSTPLSGSLTDPASGLPAAGSAFPAGTRFYADPENPAAQWGAQHPDDPRAARIRDRIAVRPQAGWIADPDPQTAQTQVRGFVGSAGLAGAVPVLVAYAIPNRDCGGASAGGTADLAGYRVWTDAVAHGLGHATAVVILEPDALAHTSCLDPRQIADRYRALSYAARALHRADPRVRVYYDAGNSGWQPAATMAARLRSAGVSDNGDGIALNVANFNSTRDETRYGLDVLRDLNDPRLGMVIDTSRNGAGPAPGHPYCDPSGRRLGTAPTADTGVAGVDAYLWVKQPGQADGCAAVPGSFSPDTAYRLAR